LVSFRHKIIIATMVSRRVALLSLLLPLLNLWSALGVVEEADEVVASRIEVVMKFSNMEKGMSLSFQDMVLIQDAYIFQLNRFMAQTFKASGLFCDNFFTSEFANTFRAVADVGKGEKKDRRNLQFIPPSIITDIMAGGVCNFCSSDDLGQRRARKARELFYGERSKFRRGDDEGGEDEDEEESAVLKMEEMSEDDKKKFLGALSLYGSDDEKYGNIPNVAEGLFHILKDSPYGEDVRQSFVDMDCLCMAWSNDVMHYYPELDDCKQFCPSFPASSGYIPEQEEKEPINFKKRSKKWKALMKTKKGTNSFKKVDLKDKRFYEVFVRTRKQPGVGKRTYALYISRDQTIAEVKKKLEKEEGIPVDQQELRYGGQLLRDWRTVRYYNIKRLTYIRLRMLPTNKD